MKAKYYLGISKNGIPTSDDPVLPGCLEEEERRPLLEAFKAGQITKKQYIEKLKALLVKKKGNAPSFLTLVLQHGDLIVMHGAGLQKYYEVCRTQTFYEWGEAFN